MGSTDDQALTAAYHAFYEELKARDPGAYAELVEADAKQKRIDYTEISRPSMDRYPAPEPEETHRISDGSGKLTKRQYQLHSLVMAGKTDTEIMAALKIGPDAYIRLSARVRERLQDPHWHRKRCVKRVKNVR
jgi:DNA-binding NarL/FixJ family response regulator